MVTIPIALILVALVLTGYTLVKQDGKGPSTWALLFVCLALLWAHVVVLVK